MKRSSHLNSRRRSRKPRRLASRLARQSRANLPPLRTKSTVLPPVRGGRLAPCDPENLPFSVKKRLRVVDTRRRHFLESFAVPAAVFGAFSAWNLAGLPPNIEPKIPSKSQNIPSTFWAQYWRN
jgi:hypothetical protein